jgi:hypothetical protein
LCDLGLIAGRRNVISCTAGEERKRVGGILKPPHKTHTNTHIKLHLHAQTLKLKIKREKGRTKYHI